MNPRDLGMKDDEIISMNRDTREAARKVRRCYKLILRDPDDRSLQMAFLDALLAWRDSVKELENRG